MRFIVQLGRFTLIFFLIVVFLTHMSLVWLVIWDQWKRTYWSNRLMCIYTTWGTQILGFKVNTIYHGEKEQPMGLYVGNHLSYMDILVLSSIIPSCFVTSKEIQKTPLLGQITRMAGCLFIERRNKLNLLNEIAELRDAMRLGLRVTVYPEATSTNGEQILRFRRPLFGAAIEAPAPVVPFCLNYRKVDGKPLDLSNRDTVFWYGDMPFASHLWNLAGQLKGVEVDLHFLKPLPMTITDSTEMAAAAQAAVEAVFLPVKPQMEKGPSSGPFLQKTLD